MKYSSKSQAENGMDNTTIMTPLRVKQSIAVNSPTAPTQLQADWNETDSTKMDYIKNKPLVPSKTSELQNDSGFITSDDLPQVETMPTATSSFAGKILQYVGATTQDYTTGYFYECVNNGGTYTWEQINVQPSAVGDNGVPRYYLKCDGASYNKMTTANKPVILAILNYYLSHNNQLPFVFFRKSGNDYKEVHSIKYQTYSASYSSVTFTIADNLHYASNSSYGVSYYTYYKSGNFTIYVRPSEWDNGQLTEVSFSSDWSDTSSSQCTPSGITSIGVLPKNLNVLGTSNTSSYTPTGDYNPATKKYVDDSVPSNTSDLVNDGETGSLKYLEKDETNGQLWKLGLTNDGHLYYESQVSRVDLTLANLSDVGDSNTIVLEYGDTDFASKMQDATTNGKAVLLHYPNSITQTLPRGTSLGGAIYSGDHTTFVLSNYSKTILPGGLYSSYIYEFSTPVSYISNTNGEPGHTYYQLKVTYNEANNETTWYEPVQQILEGKIDDLSTIRSGAAKGNTALQPGDNVSELANDANYVVNETDPVFMLSPAYTITNNNIYNWNAKQEALVSGNNIKTINNQSILGSGNINIQTGATYYFDGQNTPANVAMINQICAAYDGGAEINFTGKFADYETGQIFQAPINVVKYTDAEMNTWCSFVSDPVAWFDDSVTPATTYYLTFALNLEGTWGEFTSVSQFRLDTMTPEEWSAKQDALVSGTNIKTINNQSLLGSGNINISGGISDVKVNNTSIVSSGVANLVTKTAYNASTNKIVTESDLPTVPTKTSDLTNDSNFVSDASYVHTDNNYTTTEKNKLAGIAAGAEVNVQSDWNVSDSTSDAFIKNKPTIPTVNNAKLTIQKNGTTVKTFTANASTDVTANITVPTKTSDLTNDSGYITGYTETDPIFSASPAAGITNANITQWNAAEQNVQADWNVTSSSSDAYIKNKPTIPTKTSDLNNDSNFVADASYVHTDNNYTTTEKNKLSGIASGAEVNVQSDWSQSDNTKDDYIKNKPTIPTVNNGTLTIQKNGTNVQTFSANQSGNATANITVPTKVSDLTNDSGFLTTETDPVFSASAASGITSSNISSWTGKQDALVSGTNIKTINNQSILGSGNIDVGGIGTEVDPVFEASVAATINQTDINYWTSKQDELESGVNIKTINGYPILGPGDLIIGEGGVVATDVEINGVSITNQGSANIIVDGTYNPSTNKIATQSSVSEAIGDAIEEIDYVTYKVESFTNPILGTTSNVGVVTVGKPNNPIQIKLSNNVAKIRLNNNDVVYIGTDASGKSRIFANNMNALQNIKIGEFSWSKLSDGSIVFGGDE